MLWNMQKIIGTFSSEIPEEETIHWLREGRFYYSAYEKQHELCLQTYMCC